MFSFLGKIPIRTIDFSDPADVARYDRMALLVEQMLSLHKQLPLARTPHEQTALERQIEAADRQIDALVYELYGLDGGGDRDCGGKGIRGMPERWIGRTPVVMSYGKY